MIFHHRPGAAIFPATITRLWGLVCAQPHNPPQTNPVFRYQRKGKAAPSAGLQLAVAFSIIWGLWPTMLRAENQTPKTGEYTITGAPISNRFMNIVLTRLMAVPATYGGWPNNGYNGHDPENNHIPSHFVVYVPPAYRPDGTWGLMVYVFPSDQSGVPGGWRTICQRHHLLLIVPQNAGNGHWIPWREALTLKAALEMHRRYKLNLHRIYTGGSSGGGRNASKAPILFPDVFTGAICNCGADFVDKMGNVDCFNAQPQMLSTARSRCRFFLYTGTRDGNEQQTLAVSKWMKQLGFRYVTFFDQKGAGHAQMSNKNFEKGIVTLDAPLVTKVPSEVTRANRLVKEKRLGRAMWLLNKAALIAPGTPACDAAQGAFDKLLVAYKKALSQTRAIIAARNQAKSNMAISTFALEYSPWAVDDVRKLRQEASQAK